ncbi:MAG: hypothetical protein V3U02_06860 [Calditrichia bacterium]
MRLIKVLPTYWSGFIVILMICGIVWGEAVYIQPEYTLITFLLWIFPIVGCVWLSFELKWHILLKPKKAVN